MSSQKSPDRLDKQPSEPKALDFDYAALDAQTRLFVQQRRSEIKTLMRRAASDIFALRQKLIQVTAVEIRKIYVFGCSAASALNSRLPLVWQLLPKFILSLEFGNCFHWSHFLTLLLVQILDNWHLPLTCPNFGQLATIPYLSKFWTTGIYLLLVHIMDN